MSVCLMAVRDGRDETHERALESLRANLPGFDYEVVVDDTHHLLGFAGAIREGWEGVRQAGCEFCFHFEADFLFNRPVDLERMIHRLSKTPKLAQMSLKRQPVNPQEVEAGGFVELAPDNYVECRADEDVWLQHQVCFTTNPSVYPVALMRFGWPRRKHSEGHFTQSLLGHGFEFGIWGSKDGSPAIEHIGERIGRGY